MSGLHTELVGTGRPAVIYLHGLFGRGRNWSGIASRIAEAGHPGVLIDLPNHGQSPWTDSIDYRLMTDAVADELQLRLGSAARVAVVGHSMGGKVAMLLALHYPELVSALAVIDIAPADSSASDSFVSLVAALRALELSGLTSRGQADRELAVAIPDPAVRSFLLQNLRRQPSWHWQPNLELIASSLDRIRAWPEPQRAAFEGPVGWITGARSPYVQPENVPEMTRLFPAVQRLIIPDAGHWVQADQPEAVTAALLDLLARAGISPRSPK